MISGARAGCSRDGRRDAGATNMKLKFRWLTESLYAIVRLAPDTDIPVWATKGSFTSITRTNDELSIVCPVENLPPDVEPKHRWNCLKLEGPFPFSMTG